MCKRGRLRYLVLALGLAGCESRLERYQHARTDLMIADLRHSRYAHLVDSTSQLCAPGMPVDSACTGLSALFDSLAASELQLKDAQKAMRRFDE